MYNKILKNRLKGKIKVVAIHPGWVRTNISKSSSEFGRLTPHVSAQRIYNFIVSDFKNGIFWDVENQKKLKW